MARGENVIGRNKDLSKKEKKLYAFIGAKLTRLRKKKGYRNQEFFAYASGIPRAQYSRYEKGCNMNIDTLLRIIDFHKITFEQFFKGYKK